MNSLETQLLKEERELDFLTRTEPESEKCKDQFDKVKKLKAKIIPPLPEDLTTPNSRSIVDDRYRKAVKELERIYDFFNEEFTDSTLPSNVIITIQTRGRRRTSLGWFSPDQWVEDGDKYSEINISAETLSLNGEEELVDTLLHEMAHLKCYQDEIHDVSGDGYHNKKYKTVAETFGLLVEKSKYYGYNVTKLSDGTKILVKDLKIDKSVFTTVRIDKPTIVEEKYDNLLIRKSFKPVVREFSELSGMSMIDLTEAAITQYMESYKD